VVDVVDIYEIGRTFKKKKGGIFTPLKKPEI